MRSIFFLSALTALTTSCTTLDQSFRLGAATGALAGAAATFGSEKGSGRNPTMEDVGIGASVGLGIGLITAYFVHQSVAEDREEASRQTEVYFGDLPPSPFVFPKSNSKKGNR